jgi:hypothetical protein
VAYAAFMGDYWMVNAPAPTSTDATVVPATDTTSTTAAPESEEEDTGVSVAAASQLPNNIRGIPVIIHTNREEQRREVIRLLRDLVNIGRDQNNQITLTVAEAALSLLLEGWDVEATVLRWRQPDIIRWQLHHNLDHLRLSTSNRVEIDDRLARMVILTGRNDWYSVQEFLKARNQDLMMGILLWYRNGIPVVKAEGWDDPAKRYAGRRLAFDGEPLSPMPTDAEARAMNVPGDKWPFMELTFKPAGPQPAERLAQPPKVMKAKPSKRVPGFIFDPDEEAPVLGAVVPSKFIVDYIQDGKYRINGFEWAKYWRDEFPESETNKRSNPVFDFARQPHVSHLGSWRRQNQARITQKLKRERAQKFCKEETGFLFDLCEDILQKQLANNPGKTREDLLPLRFTGGAADALEDDFNEQFEGNRPGGAKEPRHHRSGMSLRIKASRDPKISKAFKLKPAADDDNEEEGDVTLEDATEDSTELNGETFAATPRLYIKTAGELAADIEARAEDQRQAAGKTVVGDGAKMASVEGGDKTKSRPPALVIVGGRVELIEHTGESSDDEDLEFELEDFEDD